MRPKSGHGGHGKLKWAGIATLALAILAFITRL